MLRANLRKEAARREAGDLAGATNYKRQADHLIDMLGRDPGMWEMDAHMHGLIVAK